MDFSELSFLDLFPEDDRELLRKYNALTDEQKMELRKKMDELLSKNHS